MKFEQSLIRLFLVISIVLNTTALNASTYDDDILNIFSKIIPRFIIMSSQKEKIKERIEICVLHDARDEFAALSLIDKVNTNYPNGIKNHTIDLVNTTYSKLTKCENTQLVFMFNSNEKNINDALAFSKKYNILTMSYDEALLENGVAISLFIGRKVLPHINIKATTDNKIELDNILLRVSKIYHGKEK